MLPDLWYKNAVFYSLDLAFANNETVLRIMDVQPIHEFLSLGRSIFLDTPGFTAPPEYWLYASLWAVASIVVGSLFFWAAEERYGRVD